MRRLASLALTPLLFPALATAQLPMRPPALAAITATDLRRDIDYLASDAMRGRESGTVDELRAGVWLADQMRRIGLQPAGDDGSFLQWWPLRRMRLSDGSAVRVDGKALRIGEDVIVTAPPEQSLTFPRDTALDVPLVYAGEGKESDVATLDVKGKAVVISISRPPNASTTVSLAAVRATLTALFTQPRPLFARGAAVVVLVADSSATEAFDFLSAALSRGSYSIGRNEPVNPRPTSKIPLLLVSRTMGDAVRGGARLTLRLSSESFVYPSMNVVGKLVGTDPTLRHEYVIFSGHHDHDGVRAPVNGDSIYNGADDNASTAVAVLAIARAWKQHPGKRSALFIIHGAEERGLLGSQWHVEHPVVPRASMVAVLDGDLLGRNSPDSAVLLGAQPPHRTSTALVTMAMKANALVSKFVVDTTLDHPDQAEGAFFRSDHLPYVRAGIPGLFYSSWLEPDYHTPRDEPKLINERKLALMAQWMYTTGWFVSETKQRVTMDPGFKLER